MSLLLRIFRRPDYQSDVTQFIEQLKKEKPDLEAQQRAGRAIWWDKNLDRAQLEEWREAKRQRLSTYGWSDRRKNLIHIPIDRAMDEVVSQAAANPAPGGSQP